MSLSHPKSCQMVYGSANIQLCDRSTVAGKVLCQQCLDDLATSTEEATEGGLSLRERS